MDSQERLINDPERIRAVTHPLRLRLLDLLKDRGELTATECAEATGESVAGCSFHLRMLEKYGFIERSEQRGREKPWKLVGSGSYATGVDPDVPGSLQATTELARLTIAHRTQGMLEALAHAHREPPEWLDATRLMNIAFWATAEEAAALADEIHDLLQRHTGRNDPAAQRPPGARRVRVMTAMYADPAPRAP